MSALRFENLEVWKSSVNLCSNIYNSLNGLRDYGFKQQITRSALSISSNIAEGFERETNRECIRFLFYAKGSCGELRSQIFVGMKINYISKNLGENWIRQAESISYMLNGLIKTRRNF